MTDSTVKNLNAISGATPAGLQATDLLYAVRPGSPDADFKATGSDVATLAAASAPVQSVAGRTGTVTLSTSDVSGLGTIATQSAASVTITGGSITGLSPPSAGSDAATKTYVDAKTVTFTGDVTGTGAGSIALSIGAGKVTNAMLAGAITAANLVGTDITAVGTITTGTWSAGTIVVNKGGTGLTSGTSGGILYYSASGTLASSAQLDANAVVVGGGAGGAPVKTPVTVDPSTGAIAGFAATFNNQSGTTYTLASSDAGKTVTLNNASAITVTLPNSLPAGFTCECIQLGAGQVTFSAASGATLNNRQSQTKIAGQHGAARLAVTANSGGTAAIYNLAGDTA